MTNQITFHNVDDVTVLVDNGRTVEVVYINFSKTCDTGSPNRLRTAGKIQVKEAYKEVD